MAPPLPQHGIKLAVNIIATDFGQIVAKVCECLLRRGHMTKALISRFTDIPQSKIMKCLWVLIQHNCVQAFALEQEGGARDTTVVVTQYMAVLSNIICRLRCAKFLSFVSKELDGEALEILKGLLQHGRLTLPQVLDRTAEISENEACRDTCNKSFTKLVLGRFVERCPAAEPFIPLPTEEENSKQSRPKARKLARMEVSLEERALAASIPMDAERFSILNEFDVDSNTDKNEGNKLPMAKVGDKRKQDSLELDGELDILGAKPEPVWRVNFEEFINHLRKKACVDYVREAHDNIAAVTLHSMLKGTKSTDNTVSLSIDSIYEEVVKSEEGRDMNLELVRGSLEQLQFCSEDEDVYSIDLKNIIEKAQLQEVESLVSKRYGDEAFRIFRSLSTESALHTDQISEKTLTDKKDTPKILYWLWQENFLEMEKLSTGGQKQTDLILWNVKMDKIRRKFLDELHHAALNLSLRCAYEVEKANEINIMCKSAGTGKVPAELEEKRRHGQQVYIALNKSLMDIDDAIMLFSDFLI